jgi:hypothetical protein
MRKLIYAYAFTLRLCSVYVLGMIRIPLEPDKGANSMTSEETIAEALADLEDMAVQAAP